MLATATRRNTCSLNTVLKLAEGIQTYGRGITNRFVSPIV